MINRWVSSVVCLVFKNDINLLCLAQTPETQKAKSIINSLNKISVEMTTNTVLDTAIKSIESHTFQKKSKFAWNNNDLVVYMVFRELALNIDYKDDENQHIQLAKLFLFASTENAKYFFAFRRMYFQSLHEIALNIQKKCKSDEFYYFDILRECVARFMFSHSFTSPKAKL
jgi:hypothetical protein